MLSLILTLAKNGQLKKLFSLLTLPMRKDQLYILDLPETYSFYFISFRQHKLQLIVIYATIQKIGLTPNFISQIAST